jgi:TolB-like protein
MSLLEELKRRNVLRVTAAYAGIAWLLIQVVETVFPLFEVPDESARLVVLLCAAGFVPVVLLSWFVELTPDGIRLDATISDAERAAYATSQRRFDRWIMVILAAALTYFVFDRFVLAPEREARIADVAREAGRSEAVIRSYGDKSIAVLPFEDLSPNKDQQYFSDGISEEILNQLVRISDLRVISRSSSFALRDQGLSVPEMATKLTAAYILEGSVRKAGDTVRITAQLIEAATDTHVWSDTYDRQLTNIFRVQDEISGEIATRLSLTLNEPDMVDSEIDPDSYDLYLKGISLLARRGENIKDAGPLFRQVTERHPDWASGWSALAEWSVWRSDSGNQNHEDLVLDYANKALALNPRDSRALSAKGMVLDNRNQKIEARQAFIQAIDENPSNAMAYRWLGRSYSGFNPRRYLDYVRKSQLVNPLDPTIHFHLSGAFYQLGEIDQAIEQSEQIADPWLRFARSAELLSDQGRWEAALRLVYQKYSENPQDNVWAFMPVSLRFMDIDPGLALEWIEAQGDDLSMPQFQLAVINWLNGRHKQAQGILDTRISDPGEAAPLHILLNRDCNQAIELLEPGVANQSPRSAFDGLPFSFYMFCLSETGQREKAQQLAVLLIENLREAQSNGLLLFAEFSIHNILAQSYFLLGNIDAAIDELRKDQARGTLCRTCVEKWPQFDIARDHPAVREILSMEKLRNEATRVELMNRGLLLTPGEVLALDPGFQYWCQSKVPE